ICTGNYGTGSIANLRSFAIAFLTAYPNTTTSGLLRGTAEAAKDIFDIIANNGTFTTAAQCGGSMQFVGGSSPCVISGTYGPLPGVQAHRNEIASVTPKDFALYGNYPNPFNPLTS